MAVLAVERDRDLVQFRLRLELVLTLDAEALQRAIDFGFLAPLDEERGLASAASRAAAIVIDRDQGVVVGRYRLAEADQIALDAAEAACCP